jgi:DNA helicase IV
MSDQTQGNDPSKSQGTDAPKAFTAEQLDQVSQVAAQVVNSGFTARTKKLREEIIAEFTKGLEPLSKRLEELAANPASKPSKTPSTKREEDDPVAEPKIAGLQRQMADLQKQLDERDRKIAESEAKQRAMSLRQSLMRTLGDNGFSDQVRAEDAVDLLLARGQVKHDDDGNAVFIENENSVLDLANGIKAWAKTDRAKNFLPPTGARGSGDRPGQGANPRSTQTPTEASATDLGLALVREFGGVPIG